MEFDEELRDLYCLIDRFGLRCITMLDRLLDFGRQPAELQTSTSIELLLDYSRVGRKCPEKMSRRTRLKVVSGSHMTRIGTPSEDWC